MKVYPHLDERLTKFILSQPVFFVATAPCLAASGEGGHVNVSQRRSAEQLAAYRAEHNSASIDGLPALG